MRLENVSWFTICFLIVSFPATSHQQVDGVFGPWTAWVSQGCPITCGTGVEPFTRERLCNNPAPTSGGRNCTGSFTDQKSEFCTRFPCPVDGGYTPWTSWNNPSCSVTCGSGVQNLSRTRTCTNPVPQNGGRSCVAIGPPTETFSRICVPSSCPVNGGEGPWTQWQTVGPCNGTCGQDVFFQRTRARQCNSPTPANGGAPCANPLVETGLVNCGFDNCPINGGVSEWSQWSQPNCSQWTCGVRSGPVFRTRTCSNPPPQFGGVFCGESLDETSTRPCNLGNCPIDGGFSVWTPWAPIGACSRTCGGGTRQFRAERQCNNPTPLFGGLPCQGILFNITTRECNTQFCAIDGNWTPWTQWTYEGPCDVTCGPGLARWSRSRSCTNPPPVFNGVTCPGSDVEFDPRSCNDRNCTVDGGYSPWTQWVLTSSCSVTCGGGGEQYRRSRTCTNPSPRDGGADCQGLSTDFETRTCNTNNCPIDGVYSDWTPWVSSGCNVTCGGGGERRTRSRFCNNPPPQFNGADCVGPASVSEVLSCSNDNCPIDGAYSPWTQWSPIGGCSVTCGSGNQLYGRNRVCNNPAPQFGGRDCVGVATQNEQRACIQGNCPINGGYTPWAQWTTSGTCNVTCGGGFQPWSRSRTCTNPVPQFGGLSCFGAPSETIQRRCNPNNCPIDGVFNFWTQWMVTIPCTQSCAGGTETYTRTRQCNNPAPLFGGLNCTGDYDDVDVRNCNPGACPIDGGYGPWAPWDNPPCPITCGGGVRQFTASRQCNNPTPQFNGRSCSGPFIKIQSRNCSTNPCPLNGLFGPWVEWAYVSPCSVSCGLGARNQVRDRLCDSPPPRNGGLNCLGNNKEQRTVSCDVGQCPGLQAELKNTSIRVGDTTLFRLTVDSGNLGRWYKDGTEIQEEVNRVVIVGAGRERQLIVYDSRVSDGGVYMFQWNNQSTSATLTVGDCLPFSLEDESTRRVFSIEQRQPGTTYYTKEICDINKQAMGHITCKGGTMTGGRWGCFELNKACNLSDLADSGITINLQILSETNITAINLSQILFNTVTIIRNTELDVKDMVYLASIFEKSARVSNITPANLNELIIIMTKVETTRTDVLTRAQLRGNVANRILESLDEVTDKLVFPGAAYITPDVHSFTSLTWNLKHPALTQLPLGLQLRGDNSNPRNQVLMSVFDVPDSQNTVDTDTAIFFTETFIHTLVHGPPDEDVRMTFNVHRNPKLFEVSQNLTRFPPKYVLNSKVISARIVVNGKPVSFLGGEKVTLIFKPEKILPEEHRDKLISCGYWDFAGEDNTGTWATDGCVHAMQNGRDVCKFNHLTNFAVLMDFYGQSKLDASHEMSLSIISIVGLSLSIIGLSITVLSFLAFRKLRQTRSQRTLFNLALAELCSFVVFLAGINQTQSHVGCIVVAALLHYFILASFLWMLAEAVLHYLLFVKVLGTDTPRYMLKVGIPAWCLPLLPIIIVMTINSNLYRGGEKYCWMSLSAFYYGFALPVGLIILCNIILYIIIVFNICRRSRMMQAHSSQSDGSRTLLNIRVSILCFILLGISWIFGFLTISDARVVFQYVFCITNSIQGFLIFVLFTARNKHVWDSWLGLCCRKKPGTYVSGDFRTSAKSLRTSAHDKN